MAKFQDEFPVLSKHYGYVYITQVIYRRRNCVLRVSVRSIHEGNAYIDRVENATALYRYPGKRHRSGKAYTIQVTCHYSTPWIKPLLKRRINHRAMYYDPFPVSLKLVFVAVNIRPHLSSVTWREYIHSPCNAPSQLSRMKGVHTKSSYYAPA